MKKVFHHLAALGLTAAALSSCSRTAYTSFSPQTPAYLGSTRVMAPPRVAVTPAVAAPLPAAPAPEVAATAPASHLTTISSRPKQATQVAAVVSPVATIASPQASNPTFVQRLALKKVMKQLAKAEKRQQNTAGVAKTAAKGAPLTVAIVGLIALVVGLIASSGLLIVLGSIVLAVGIILLILSIL